MTGTAISQALPIALSPVLTRIYTPEDFGLLAIFMSITAVIGTVITGKYELAIMLPKTDREALSLVKLSILISFIISLILFVIVVFFHNHITLLLGNTKIDKWLFLVPVSVFLIGVFTTLNVYNNRLKNYKIMSKSLIIKSSGMTFFQIGFGFIKLISGGLIIGQFISYLFGNSVLAKPILKRKKTIKSISNTEMKNSAKKYINFLKFSTPGILLNSLSLNVNSFLITSLFSTAILGFYSMANKILGLPSALFGANISTIYFQKLSEVRHDYIRSKEVYSSVLKKLLLISLPIFILLFCIIKPLFTFVFGEDWYISGEIARVLVPMFFIRFVSSALSPTIEVYEKQFFSIIINAVLLGSIAIVFFISKIYHYSYLEFFTLFSLFLSISYMLFLYIYYKIIINSRI